LNQSDILARFEALHRFRSDEGHGGYAPYKPLVLLYAIHQLCVHGERLLLFRAHEESLRQLMERFGLPSQRQNPAYPFWRLQADGIWEVLADQPLASRQSNTDPPLTELRAKNARGGFTNEVAAELLCDPHFRLAAVSTIVTVGFGVEYRAEVLRALGLAVASDASPKNDSNLA